MRTAFLLTFVIGFAYGQNRYMIKFKDKGNYEVSDFEPSDLLSNRAIERRKKHDIALKTEDLPVYRPYLSQISKHVFKILLTSKWWNGCLVEASDFQVEKIGSFDFVASVQEAAVGVTPQREMINFGAAFQQLNLLSINQMQINGFTGKGVLVGVIDAGFVGVDSLSVFNSIKGRYSYIDLISRSSVPVAGGDHGTMVLSLLAAIEDQRYRGAIPDADFVLIRTENTLEETRAEEFQLLAALEVCDSLGVDIVNISLGYTTFDSQDQDHTYQDLDGKTTLSSWACNLAGQSGILVVTSAGNQGDKTWKYISAPADADSVLAVGAVDFTRMVAPFSSRGPRMDGKIKPEVVAPGYGVLAYNRRGSLLTGYGTSFAAPLVTGLAAGLLQARPELKSWQIKDLIIKTSSNYSTPNDSVGYGIPDFMEAYRILNPNNLGELEYVALKNPLSRGEHLCSDFPIERVRLSDAQGRDFFIKLENNCILINSELAMGIYFLDIFSQNFTRKYRILIL